MSTVTLHVEQVLVRSDFEAKSIDAFDDFTVASLQLLHFAAFVSELLLVLVLQLMELAFSKGKLRLQFLQFTRQVAIELSQFHLLFSCVVDSKEQFVHRCICHSNIAWPLVRQSGLVHELLDDLDLARVVD